VKIVAEAAVVDIVVVAVEAVAGKRPLYGNRHGTANQIIVQIRGEPNEWARLFSCAEIQSKPDDGSLNFENRSN
jgi:hypothetical protein